MHTLPSRQGGRFATQGSYYGQILPSIEAHRTFTPYGGPGGPQSEVDAASEAASHADPGIRMKRLEAQNQEFKKAIEGLTDELVLAGATLRSQDIRVSQLEDRMQIYHNTASDLYDAETEFARQASKLRSIVFGVKRITEVAAEVYASLANGSPDNLGANNVVDTVRNHQEKVTQNRTGNNTITGMNGINVIVAHSGDAGSDTVNPNNSQVSDTDMTEVEESLDGHNGGAGTVG